MKTLILCIVLLITGCQNTTVRPVIKDIPPKEISIDIRGELYANDL